MLQQGGVYYMQPTECTMTPTWFVSVAADPGCSVLHACEIQQDNPRVQEESEGEKLTRETDAIGMNDYDHNNNNDKQQLQWKQLGLPGPRV
jgi:hypothetical protein